ncbi:ATP-binding protein [Streptomyces pactum]|uniref:ATP-binding protein n=1 Tax=Streptomyces pactum TaxID=68249 RepID=A0ABS0NKF9_9ACTN|nr:ATP-binding protein [Streptomyces pactum]MBH5335684.1 ATP-binding protein [Streptomyces pactum]
MGVRTDPGARASHPSRPAPPEPAGSYVLSAPATPIAPKVCRDLVRSVLGALGLEELVDPATLCVSELVTNVHRHAKGDVRLTVTVEPGRVRVSVYDECPESLPAPRRVGREETGGRGLFLVTAVSDDCGVVVGKPPSPVGKSVWFQLAIPPGSARQEGAAHEGGEGGRA